MWIRARLTEVDDVDWYGLRIGEPDSPTDAEIFKAGSDPGATIVDGKIWTLATWCIDNGDFIAGAGTITLSLAHIASLAPFAPNQVLERVTVSQTKVDRPAWELVTFDVVPGRYTIHMDNRAPPIGATRAALWYWRADSR